MRNWIAEQGLGLYIMIGMAIVGVIGSIVCRVFYGRLAREAQICGTSDYPMLHYIRQKYTSYYKLGMQPLDAKVIVGRYMSLHKVGLLPLNAYRYVRVLMTAGILMNGLIGSIYRYQQAFQAGPALVYLGTSLVMALGLWMVGLLLGVDNQYRIAENSINDYLENYLKSKLDGEYGYGHPAVEPDNYEQALRESAAARTTSARVPAGSNTEYARRKGSRPAGHPIRDNRENDAVDARIVEDVLKEFLC